MLKRKHLMSADGVAVFLLGALFLFLSIGLVLLGGSVYRQVVAASQENDQMRTAFSYIANQVRRCDSGGNVQVGKFHNVDALLLLQEFGDIECVTYLYCWEGSLRELFVEVDNELDMEAGLPLIPLDAISFSQDHNGLILVEAQFTGGLKGSFSLLPRSAAVGGDS
ncbi:MAG: DUF4860 domain-containing protein [Clostridiales bacterium]|nr:DUF4860 domain-containing protein [Clostridiales bacterium]